MLAKVHSGAVVGLDAVPVEVEVDLTKRGMPAFTIVGLGNKAVQEAKERVTSAIINSSADFPKYRLTVNLAPADLPKEGPAYDLPIALGTLIVNGQIPESTELNESLVLGELSLDGTLRPTPGALPLTLLAKEQGLKQVFLPAVNSKEAAIVSGISVFPVSSLSELFYHFVDLKKISPHPKVS
ncbi:MAG: ATP-binding protein, partial [Candidatus Cloacimonetes bacterium]|nr:ATP-binding protein [Candidatus Cloacimonadota bacterium]